MMRVVRAAFLAGFILSSQASIAAAGPGNADRTDRCVGDGYLTVVGTADIGNLIFDSPAECMAYVASGGVLIQAIPLPAGATFSLEDPVLSSCNALTWAWGGSGAVFFLDSKPAGCGTLAGSEATFGPFPVDAAFGIALRDDSCGGVLFPSNGDHGAETFLGGGEWTVDVMDAGAACEFATVPREPTGPGNLRVRVIVHAAPGPGTPGGNSAAAADCTGGGYQRYTDAAGNPFRGVGACVMFVARGGTLVPVTASPFSVAYEVVEPDGLRAVVTGTGLEPMTPVSVVLNDTGGGVAAGGQSDASGAASLTLDSACGLDFVSLTATGTPAGGVETDYSLPLPDPSICQ